MSKHAKIPRYVVTAVKRFVKDVVGLIPASDLLKRLKGIGVEASIDLKGPFLRLGAVKMQLIDVHEGQDSTFGQYFLKDKSIKAEDERYWVDMTALAPALFCYCYGHYPDRQEMLELLDPEAAAKPQGKPKLSMN